MNIQPSPTKLGGTQTASHYEMTLSRKVRPPRPSTSRCSLRKFESRCSSEQGDLPDQDKTKPTTTYHQQYKRG